MAVCQNLVPLVNIKIAGKWMFIPLKMVLIGIDPSPYVSQIASPPTGMGSSASSHHHCRHSDARTDALGQALVRLEEERNKLETNLKRTKEQTRVILGEMSHRKGKANAAIGCNRVV